MPRDGLWVEVLNTNAKKYGGNGDGNPNGAQAQPIQWDGRPFAVDLRLPGMAVMFFLPEVPETPKPESAQPKEPAKKP